MRSGRRLTAGALMNSYLRVLYSGQGDVESMPASELRLNSLTASWTFAARPKRSSCDHAGQGGCGDACLGGGSVAWAAARLPGQRLGSAASPHCRC